LVLGQKPKEVIGTVKLFTTPRKFVEVLAHEYTLGPKFDARRYRDPPRTNSIRQPSKNAVGGLAQSQKCLRNVSSEQQGGVHLSVVTLSRLFRDSNELIFDSVGHQKLANSAD
jgi:hypothetical protein